MKLTQYVTTIALAYLATITSIGQAQEPKKQLDTALAHTQSESPDDRIHGFRELRQVWNRSSTASYFEAPSIIIRRSRPPIPSDDVVDQVANAIERGLADDNADVREAAAIALIVAPSPRPSVISAVQTGLLRNDPTSTAYIAQMKCDALPPVETVIDSLLEQVRSADSFSAMWVSQVLRDYGPDARRYSAQLMEAALTNIDEGRVEFLLNSLADVTLSEEAAENLASRTGTLSEDQLGIAAVCLLEHPKLLRRIEQDRPEIVEALQRYKLRLFSFLCDHQNDDHETVAWLSASDQLHPLTMAWLGEGRFIKTIEVQSKQASKYERTKLSACMRACRGDVGEQIVVDASHPIKFRPLSAGPKGDARRIGKGYEPFGCGATEILVTGQIAGPDGETPKSVKLYREICNADTGVCRLERQPLLYDGATGRFVYFGFVFATYAGGGEYGPYQTGGETMHVEADGYEPFTLTFYDEMPDVRIVLERLKAED